MMYNPIPTNTHGRDRRKRPCKWAQWIQLSQRSLRSTLATSSSMYDYESRRHPVDQSARAVGKAFRKTDDRDRACETRFYKRIDTEGERDGFCPSVR
jgi:hypothetical protein